jgi:hypothetical protein
MYAVPPYTLYPDLFYAASTRPREAAAHDSNPGPHLITRIAVKDVPCHGPKPRFMYGLGLLYRGCGPNARFCPHACIHRIVCNRQTTEQAMFAEIIDAFTGGF